MIVVSDELDTYHAITTRLSELYIECAEALAAEITTRAAAYTDLTSRGDMNITTIREHADYMAHQHKASGIRLSGDIDALLAKLRYLDVLLTRT